MADDTLTFALDGELSLRDFSIGMRYFQEFIQALTREVGQRATVDWRVAELTDGSALTTIQGQTTPAHEDVVDRVIHAYASVGQALASGTPIPYSRSVQQPAKKIAALVGTTITAVRFETSFSDAVIKKTVPATDSVPRITYAHGAVKGTIQTLTNRHGLRFTLYDALFDRPVSCYLSEGDEDKIRGAWGHRVIVSGQVGRDPEARRPVVIRHITEVQRLQDVPVDNYRQARGVFPFRTGEEPSEVLIRSLRDAE